MYEPDVTIITPTLNIVEKDLADDFTLLINLLARQTYPNIEHLIMDGGSNDGTEILLKEYKNGGYINFYSEPDRSKFEAMNKGILRAKGKYLAFLSCDDFYHDITGIADIVNIMEAEEADFCFFPSYCIHPDGYVFFFGPSILSTFQVAPCPRQALFIKKTVLNELKGFDEKFSLLADYDLIIRLILNKYKGVLFDGNILTYKLGEEVTNHTVQAEAECNHIYYKNYRTLYPITNEEVDRIVKYSELPKALLEKLANRFPEEDRELFYARYEEMCKLRKEALKHSQE